MTTPATNQTVSAPMQAAPMARCLCSHSVRQHTRGEGNCWLRACGCTTYRPKETGQ
jgi:hypothetical protein